MYRLPSFCLIFSSIYRANYLLEGPSSASVKSNTASLIIMDHSKRKRRFLSQSISGKLLVKATIINQAIKLNNRGDLNKIAIIIEFFEALAIKISTQACFGW